MLFFVVPLSHNHEFEVEHAFPHQLFPQPWFDHHDSLSGAYLSCADITYFISALVAVVRRFNKASKKEDLKNDLGGS